MKKIPTMFYRDESKNGHPVYNKIKEGCEWVLAGVGIATRKMDGTNVCIKDGKFYKRQKPKDRDYDEASYVEVEPISPENRWLMEAFNSFCALVPLDMAGGIYEACGPKIQGNPEKLERHELIRVVPPRADLVLSNVPRDFDSLKEYLSSHDIEGIVFHSFEGHMAKIKKRDFGIKR